MDFTLNDFLANLKVNIGARLTARSELPNAHELEKNFGANVIVTH